MQARSGAAVFKFNMPRLCRRRAHRHVRCLATPPRQPLQGH
jgi:hypothetical protein